MPEKQSPQQLAEDICQRLSERYPDLEFGHSAPEDFFDGYYDFGLPMEPYADFTPVWFQEGELLYWEAPHPYTWDNDRFDFNSPREADENVYVNFFFIHEDGSVSAVDDYDGRIHKLLRGPSIQELMAYVELHFEAGRQRQRANVDPAAITKISAPFFHFPDDFSEDLSTMPVVPFQYLRSTIFRHIAESKPWLFAMNDHTARLKNMEKDIEAKESDANIAGKELESKMTVEIQTEDGPLSCSGEAFFWGLLSGAQEEIEKERPQLMTDVADIPPEAFDWQWQEANYLQIQIAYSSLTNEEHLSDELLPLCLHLSNAVFPAFLLPTYCRKSHQQAYKKLCEHLKNIENTPACIALDLPPYNEQVLNCFLQEACCSQGPELARKALEGRPDSALEHTDNLERRLSIIRQLM